MRRLPKEIDDILVRHIRKYGHMRPAIIASEKPKSFVHFLKKFILKWNNLL